MYVVFFLSVSIELISHDHMSLIFFVCSTAAATEQKEDRGTFVYTWGAGYHGQLGRKGARGQKKYATVPLMVELIKATRQVACGGLHTVSLTDKGEVFAWGDGTKGQLGNLDVGYSSLMTPHPVDKLGRQVIKQISCGQRHTVGVTDQGRMYAWGEGKSGQTGLGSRNMERFPIAVDCEVRPGADSFFTQVACGDKHTVALTRKGFVYTFGCGEHGQLGHGNQADQTKPTLVEEFVAHGISVYSIATGAVHSVAVSDSGQLFVWGFGEYFYRQGGKNFYYTPQQVEFKGKIVQAACGQGHMLVLTDKGDVWTWGSGEYGQLGHGDTASNRVPRVVLENKFVAQISAGRYHSVALASNGALYTWGCGENGQLGHNSDENELIPRVVEGILSNVVGQVACGEHHTAALTSVPYNSLNAEVAEWLMMEKEEYSEKKKHVVDTRKALTRKDLLAIRQKVLAKFGVEENKLGDDLDLTPEQLEARAAKKASAASLRLAASLAAANAAMSAPKPQASPTAGQASNVALGPDGQPLLGPDGQPLPAGPYMVNGVEVPNSALSPEGFLIDITTGEKLLNPEGQPMVPDNTSLSSTLTKEDMSETNLLSRTQHHREAAAPLKTMIQVLQEAVTQGSTPAEQINAAFAQLVASRKEHDHV
jgi:alpha-tubulin suppressor-like RCC1 family protein